MRLDYPVLDTAKLALQRLDGLRCMLAEPSLACSPVTAEKYAKITFDLVEHLDAMVSYWNTDRRCVFVNSAFKFWFGRGRAELVGVSMEELLGPLYPLNLRFIDAAYAGQPQIFERDIPTPDGSNRSTLATYIPHVEASELQGIYVLEVDVSGLKKLEKEMTHAKLEAERLATHDVLTGLPNRAFLHERIARLIEQNSANDAFGIIAIDIDGFKSINDSFGHGAGDRLLMEMASRFRKSVRASDTVIRLAGDEFLVLVARVQEISEIETIADRILADARQPFLVNDAPVSASTSLGIARYPKDGSSPELLIAAADRALYQAKHSGRNRYALAE